jgi:2-polyprenyl-3-methyl-5-hydroxy-6-metoxy-1,4-benzoquinol methylase
MRIPEPTALMEDVKQCKLYNQDASNIDKLKDYVELYKRLINVSNGTVVDLGSGSCNFVIALAEHYPGLNFVCYEASFTMIELAKENIKNKHLEHRITIVQDLLENAQGSYDVVLANRVLHHIDDTATFWNTVHRLASSVLVVDIDRPPEEVINTVSDADLVNSMRAAYTFSEVYNQVKHYKYTVAKDSSYKLFIYHTR